MSWLRKAVSLWKGNTQKNSEEIPLSQIQEWIQQRSQEAVEQHHLLPLVKEHAKLLEDKRWALEVQLDVWQKKVRLHSSAQEVIPLFRETRQLLDLLHFSAQPTIGEILTVNQELERRSHQIAEKIEARNFLENFSFLFEENETPTGTNPLLAALLDLDAVRKKLDLKVAESQYHMVQLISSKAELLRKVAVHLQQLNKELGAKKGRQAATERKKQEKERSLQQLRSDKKSVDLDQLAEKKKELECRLEEKEMEVLSFFSKIKPLLQQYKEREPSNGLLFSYIQDPLSSFFQDEGLFVIELLQKMTALLREGKFYLNPEDLLSSLSALEGIYDQRLHLIKDEYKNLRKELKEVTDKTHHNFFVIKVDDAAYRLEHYRKQAKRIGEETSALTEKASKLQAALLRERQQLQSLIKSSLGRDIVIAV